MDRSGRSPASPNPVRSVTGSVHTDDDDFHVGPHRVFSPMADSPKSGQKKSKQINANRLSELMNRNSEQKPTVKEWSDESQRTQSDSQKQNKKAAKPKLAWLNNRMVIMGKSGKGPKLFGTTTKPTAVKRSAETTVEMAPNGASKPANGKSLLKGSLGANGTQKNVSPLSSAFGQGPLVALPDVEGTRPVLASSPAASWSRTTSTQTNESVQKRKPKVSVIRKNKSGGRLDQSESSSRRTPKKSDRSESSRRKAAKKPNADKSSSRKLKRKIKPLPQLKNAQKPKAEPSKPVESQMSSGMPKNFDDLCDCGLCKRMKNRGPTSSDLSQRQTKGIKLPLNNAKLSQKQAKGMRVPLTRNPVSGIKAYGLYYPHKCRNNSCSDVSQRSDRSQASAKSTEAANSLRNLSWSSFGSKSERSQKAKQPRVKSPIERASNAAAKSPAKPKPAAIIKQSPKSPLNGLNLGDFSTRLTNLLKNPFGAAAKCSTTSEKSQPKSKPTSAGSKCSSCAKKQADSQKTKPLARSTSASSTESGRQLSNRTLAQKFAQLPAKAPTQAAPIQSSSSRKTNELRMVMKVGEVTVPMVVDLGASNKEIRLKAVELGNQKLYEAKGNGVVPSLSR